MPIPLLLGVAALGLGAVGIGGHLNAKEINEEAKEIAKDAEILYNSAKESLEIAQERTEQSLLILGESKKHILETSIKQFLISYERIKNIEFIDSGKFNEIENFVLDKQDAIQLREMSDIYESTFSSTAAGAATGAVIALAASGTLPTATGILSTAGTALLAGEIGLAGSALLSLGAMIPLTAVAAPVLLFTGISSSLKAEENLEKAEAMYSEAELASEKMKTSELFCFAIVEQSDMFNELLLNLNTLFSYCTELLDGVTKKKIGFFWRKKINPAKLTSEEKKLIAVTGSLAKAVKSVIDAPILTPTGEISPKSKKIYKNTTKALTEFSNQVNEIKQISYKVKPIKIKQNKRSNILTHSKKVIIIIIILLLMGYFVSSFIFKRIG